MMEMKRNSPIRDNLKIAVLSALNIAAELHDFKVKFEETEKELSQIEDKATHLSKKIESTISV